MHVQVVYIDFALFWDEILGTSEQLQFSVEFQLQHTVVLTYNSHPKTN